jgi:hypothetical protein
LIKAFRSRLALAEEFAYADLYFAGAQGFTY